MAETVRRSGTELFRRRSKPRRYRALTGRFLLHRPLTGSTDLVQVLLLLTAGCTLPAVTWRGDMIEVRLRDEQGDRGIARGVSQYSAVDIRRIARRHSRDIEAVLGYNYGGNVVHRDDLVLL